MAGSLTLQLTCTMAVGRSLTCSLAHLLGARIQLLVTMQLTSTMNVGRSLTSSLLGYSATCWLGD
jgi:hypothetical protein